MKMENVEDVYPLSPMQQGMVFHTLAAPHSGVYVEQYCCRLHGELDIPIFQQAWAHTWEHHPVLRTAFLWEGLDEPLQIVRQQVALNWTVRDLRSQSTSQQCDELETFLRTDREIGFDLAQAPLARFQLFQLSRDMHEFVWSFHHVLSDGWSTPLVVKEVLTFYEATRSGTRIELKRVPPYRDYVAWLQEQDMERAKSFWEKTLKGFTTPTPIGLVGSSTRFDAPTTALEQQELFLSESVTKKLQSTSQEQRITLNTLVQGAWALLLARYSRTQDILYGSTVSGRPADLKGVEDMVGLFINTLPVRVCLTGEEVVGEWLRDLQTQLAESRKFEYAPLAKIQSWSELSGNQPLFENILVFENYPITEGGLNPNGSLKVRDIRYREQSNYPLALLVVPERQLQFLILYDPSRFEEQAMSAMLNHLEVLLAGMTADPDGRLRDVPLLTDPERKRLLVEWNRTDSVSQQKVHWLEYFAEQTEAHPENNAVICGNDCLSYGELNDRANQLAHYLRDQGVGSSSLVGVHLKRSPELIVALLGILKTGGAYVPLDPDYPSDRLATMIADAGISFLLTQAELKNSLPKQPIRFVMIDSDWTKIQCHTKVEPETQVDPKDLCYVIYTSGSTGTPRGVKVTHKNLLHSTAARFQVYKNPVKCFLLLSSISFDSSVAGIFWTLGQGGSLCISRSDQGMDPSILASLITQHNVSHLLCIPSLYKHLLETRESMKTLQTVIVAGESCPDNLVEQHFKTTDASLFNEYGPTEGTVWCTVFDCSNLNGRSLVPIGRPIPNARIYLLDEALQPVPAGLAGELCIGGDGVADGYINQPALTAQKFIQNPIPEEPGNILYRTGDMARMLPDGNLEFLGRCDDQIKVRGYRVEPGEIEATLRLHPDIEDVAVVFHNPPMSKKAETKMVDALHQRITELDSAEVERLLAEIEPLTDDEVNNLLLEKTEGEDRTQDHCLYVEHSDFAIRLDLKNLDFIHPPRHAQKEWLLNQALSEFKDDLIALDSLSERFVAGTPSQLKPYDISHADLEPDAIMEDWQTPIMKAMANLVTESHGDVLEIGFGRGVSSSFIQEYGVRSHTIVESNEQVVRRFHSSWKKSYAGCNTRLLQGRWQDLTDQFEKYDGIFFHAFPLNEQEFLECVLQSITFAEHFFPTAAQHLKPGGVFTYLTTEIDSLSRRHQRLLFRHFSTITLSVQSVEIPPDTKDAWWADSMVVMKAVK